MIDIEALMQYVRGKGLMIDDLGLVGPCRRFLLSRDDDRVFMDIEKMAWNEISQETLLVIANNAIKTIDRSLT